MPRHHTKRSKRSKRTRRTKHSGGAGFGYEPGGPLLPGTQLDAQITKPYDGCMTVDRPGQIAYSATGGLPGMRGGAYTNNLATGIAGFAQIDKIPCGTPVSRNFAQAGGVGGQSAQDMGVYEAPTARYTHAPSSWTTSVGSPVLTNVPMNPTLWSKACVQTAGRRRRRGVKKSRKTKKSGRRKQRGGGLLEDALAVLEANGETLKSIARKSYCGEPVVVGDITFKNTGGFYTSRLLASRNGETVVLDNDTGICTN